MNPSEALLNIRGLNAWYGDSHVLHDVSFNLREGEVVTLLGRNGAGKTTTMKSITGMLSRLSGSIMLGGRELRGLRSDLIARSGIGYCPEDRGIFASLTVTENLLLPPVISSSGMDLETIYGLFPNLKERATSNGMELSGGEQQMLAIARALRSGAKVLLFDEPTEGLAPVIVQQIMSTLRKVKERGLTLLLVEQNFRFASRIADRHYIMENGRIVDEIDNFEIQSNPDRVKKHLGV